MTPSTPPKLTPSQISEFSQVLYEARNHVQEVEPLTKAYHDFDLDDAYRIQADGIEKRLQNREKIIGYKMGLTSKAKMEQMGLHKPIYGVLTDVMQIDAGGVFSLTQKIHPKAEPEVYFITHKELKGSVSPEEALAACSSVGVALEILDSRFQGFKYFALPDVVADNASSAYFVLGEPVKPFAGMDLKNLKIQITENETVMHEDTSAAIFGNPILSLCELVKLLDEQKMTLPAGSIVLAGAATVAIQLKPDTVVAGHLEGMKSVDFKVTV